MKRANGTGSVTKLSGRRRKPYIAKVSERQEDGTYVQKSIGTFAKASEAQAALDLYNEQVRHCSLVTPEKATMTIGDVYDRWRVKAFEGLTERGVMNYTSPWKRRLESHRGRKIRDMGVDEWQAIVDADAAAGMSDGSVGKLIVLIKALCKYASMRDIIYKDYSQFIEKPQITAVKHEKGSFSPEQVEHLKRLAKEDPWAQTVLILCYTGFRIDEMLSLRPDQYHAEPFPHFKQGSKTAAGKGRDGMGREVPIHPCIQPYVTQWLDKGGRAVFCKDDGTRYTRMGYITRFDRVMCQIGLPQATPHWCRYTFETAMKRAKVEPSLIDAIIGHAEKNMGDHYTDYKLSDKVEAVCSMS